MDTQKLRNIAIIAHVDHGKTTLVDKLLMQSNTFDERFQPQERMMDSNDLEKERGITISAKNTAIKWQDYRINIVDTPGHADFGGEVERVLSMVDSVLLLVDAVDGPMPQTRFVTQKAFEQGLKPIVVINKIDRPQARPDWVIDQVFDLFDRLDANDEQLDFSIIYTSAIKGIASLHYPAKPEDTDMSCLFQCIIDMVSPPNVDIDGPLQMQITALDYSNFLGAIGIGRIKRGGITKNMMVSLIEPDGKKRHVKVGQILGFHGLERNEINSALAGDIVGVVGIDPISISDTLCDPKCPEPLTPLKVDEPTVSMTFCVNNSPTAGQDGQFVTSRLISDRLQKELIYNVALRVENTDDASVFKVSGRGELHLSVLIENMRREGFELCVGRPQVITKEIDGVLCEPFEQLTLDIEQQHQGTVMECLGLRRGECISMQPDNHGRTRLEYIIPSRGLLGFRTEFLTLTTGTGLWYSIFDQYAPFKGNKNEQLAQRNNGSLISNGVGKATAYSIFNLQKSGKFFIAPGEAVYEGMVLGIHSRDNDLVVNVTKGKQLTNIRAAGSDENIILTPPLKFDLDQAIELIKNDELVEITPNHLRIRKKLLSEIERKKHSRQAKS